MEHILTQFHTEAVSPVGNTPIDRYYQSIWNLPHYKKPDEFWELPKWIGELTHILKINNAGGITGLWLEKPERLNPKDPKEITLYLSVLDANKHLVEELVRLNPCVKFVLGGYISWKDSELSKMRNVRIYDSMEQMAYDNFLDYEYGVDWSLFKNYECIPRLTMSRGCSNKCKFCTIEDRVVGLSFEEIENQVIAMKPLAFDYIYLDDKTFGQARNYKMLSSLYHLVKYINPGFVGFIVQTTAPMAIKLAPELKTLHIKVVEVGVETFNDKILKSLRKPATEMLITKAAKAINDAGVDFVPNIIIGFRDETASTYEHTLNFLMETNMLFANIYSLALYDDAELSKEIEAGNDNDSNELVVRKSYNSEEKNDLDEYFLQLYAEKLFDKCLK